MTVHSWQSSQVPDTPWQSVCTDPTCPYATPRTARIMSLRSQWFLLIGCLCQIKLQSGFRTGEVRAHASVTTPYFSSPLDGPGSQPGLFFLESSSRRRCCLLPKWAGGRGRWAFLAPKKPRPQRPPLTDLCLAIARGVVHKFCWFTVRSLGRDLEPLPRASNPGVRGLEP